MSNFAPTLEQTWLLKASLCSGSEAQRAWEEWSGRVDFDLIDPASFRLLPLLSRNPALQSLESPIFEKCKGIYRRNWLVNQMLWKKTTLLFCSLQQQGIQTIVLLKGIALILEHYRDFGVRVIGDIDFMVPLSDAAAVGDLLQSFGWRQHVARCDLRNPRHLAHWHALNYTHLDKSCLDLHWSFIEEHSLFLDEAVLRDATLLSHFPWRIPQPTDLLLQTCVHGMKYSPIPLIRWIADAMTLLQHSSIDWDRLVHLAVNAHLTLPLSTGLHYLANTFGAPVPQSTLRQLKQAPISRLHHFEYRCHLRGYNDLAIWFRDCLHNRLSPLRRIARLSRFLQTAARLSSAWQIPFFAPYWLAKRFYKLLKIYLS